MIYPLTIWGYHTVDGRNPAPVDNCLSHDLQGFNHPFGGAGLRSHPQ